MTEEQKRQMTLALPKRPKVVSVRLPEIENKHLIFQISVAAMQAGEKVTIKDYMSRLAIDAAKRKVKLPAKKTVPTVPVDGVARRFTVYMTDEIYAAIDQLRGTPTLTVQGKEGSLVQNVDYGDADLFRELLEIEYMRQVEAFKKSSI